MKYFIAGILTLLLAITAFRYKKIAWILSEICRGYNGESSQKFKG